MSLDRRRIPLTELPSFQEGLQRRIFEINDKFEGYLNQNYTPDYYQSYLEKISKDEQNRKRTPFGEGFRSLFPGLLHPQASDSQAIQVHPSQICPLLIAQNKENTSLKEEVELQFSHFFQLKTVLDDLYRFMNIIEILLDENSKLAQHLEKKNVDMGKLIQSAAINETEEIQDLKHDIQLLEQEASVLIKHLHETQSKETNLKQEIAQLTQQLSLAKEYNDKQKWYIEASKAREEEYSKELNQLKPEIQQYLDKIEEMEITCSKHEKNIDQLQEQIIDLNTLNEVTKKDLKEVIEEKEYRLDQYQKKLKELNMELEWKINELQSKPNIIEYLLQPSPKQKAGIDYILNQPIVPGRLGVKRTTQYPFRRKCYSSKKPRTRIVKKKRTQSSISREAKVSEDFEKIRTEKNMLSNQLFQYKHDLSQEKENNEEEVKLLKSQFEKQLNKLKTEYQSVFTEKEEQIKSIESQSHEEKLQISQLKLELEKVSQELVHNRQEMADYDQLKLIVERQQIELKQQQIELEEMKDSVEKYREDLSTANSSLEERDKQRQMQISLQLSQIDELQKELEKERNNQQQEKREEQILEEEKQIEIENVKLREENNQKDHKIKEIQQSIDQIKNDYEKQITRLKQDQEKNSGTQNKKLNQEIQSLQLEIQQKDDEIKRLQKRLQQSSKDPNAELEMDKIIAEKDREIKNLRQQINQHKDQLQEKGKDQPYTPPKTPTNQYQQQVPPKQPTVTPPSGYNPTSVNPVEECLKDESLDLIPDLMASKNSSHSKSFNQTQPKGQMQYPYPQQQNFDTKSIDSRYSYNQAPSRQPSSNPYAAPLPFGKQAVSHFANPPPSKPPSYQDSKNQMQMSNAAYMKTQKYK